MGVVEEGRRGGLDVSPWGKFDLGTWTAYALLFHMLDVAAVAGELWDRFLTQAQRELVARGLGVTVDQARPLVAFLAGLHDLGKFVPYFQSCERSGWARLSEALVADAGRITAVAHPRASMHLAVHLLAEHGFEVGGHASPAVRAAQVLGGHHGRHLQVDLHAGASQARVEAVLGGPAWQELRRKYVAQLHHLTGVTCPPRCFSVPAAVLVGGLVVLADRLASQRSHWLANAHQPAFGAAEHFTRARRQAVALVEESGLVRVDLARVPFARVHYGVAVPNALQRSVLEQLPALVGELGVGITVVTDGTGTGKSVTALEMARILNEGCGTSGVCWLLPTTATADAAFEQLEAYVAAHRPEHAPVALVHNLSRMNAAYADRLLAPGTGSTLDAGREDVRGPDAPQAQDVDGSGSRGRGAGVPDAPAGAGGGRSAATMVDPWLRGPDMGLLAQFTVATVDQAQMAVLPVDFQVLRLLGLSGRTVVVDEAHAPAPFSRAQLCRLLHWLGALGSPVVLLSATMPAGDSGDMVRAYLAGAGCPRKVLGGRDLAPAYPGWLFADAATGTPAVMAAATQVRHAAAQRRAVHLVHQRVRHLPLGPDGGRAVAPDERLAVIGQAVEAVHDQGGCASVHCATVTDAQDAFRYLRSTWTGPARDLVLLHSRFPAHQRERVTSWVRAVLGRAGNRPRRLVVVATSMLDLGVDIDVDLMVSDLATLGRLLQRAGRLARFALAWQDMDGRRPSWWDPAAAPRLVVLEPVDGAGLLRLPEQWGGLEPQMPVAATAALLPALAAAPLHLPDQVQALIEQVHGCHSEATAARFGLERLLAAHRDEVGAAEHLSAVHLVPPPGRVSSLADLHREHLTAAQAVTRLGTLPRRVLSCYRTRDGLALDRDGARPLPRTGAPGPALVRAVLQHTVPVPAAWVAAAGAEHRPPDSFASHPLLAELVLLPADPRRPRRPQRFGSHLLHLDPELGLVHHRDPR